MKLSYRYILLLLIVLFLDYKGFSLSKFDNLYDIAVNSKSESDAKLALEQAIELGNEVEIAKAYYLHAYNSYNLNMYYLALNSYFEALTAYRKLENKPLEAQIIENIGIIYRKAKFYNKAINFYRDALTIKESLNDSIGIARSYYNIGRIYRLSNRPEDALKYFNLALTLYESQKNSKKISHTHNEIGLTLKQNGDHTMAIGHYEQITKGYNKGTNSWIKRETLRLNNLADLYISTGDFTLAEHYINEALKPEYKEALKPNVRSLLYYNLALVYRDKNLQDSVVSSYTKSLEGINILNFESNVLDTYTLLAEHYSSKGELDKSIENYQVIGIIAKELQDLQLVLADKNIQYQVEAANNKIQSELAAEAATNTKIQFTIFTGVCSMILVLMIFISYQQALKRKAITDKIDDDALDNLMS